MPGRDFLRALLVVAGAVSVGQGLALLPWTVRVNEVLAADPSEARMLLARELLPILYGALLIALSGPMSRILMLTRPDESPRGIPGFATSLIGVAGIVIAGLALVDLSTISLQMMVLEAGGKLLNGAAPEHGWTPWLQPLGRLILGVILLAGRGPFGRLVAARQESVAG